MKFMLSAAFNNVVVARRALPLQEQFEIPKYEQNPCLPADRRKA